MSYGPFLYDSEIELKELAKMTGSGRLGVSLRRGRTPRLLEGGVFAGAERQFTETEFLLDIPQTGRFYAFDGNTVVVEPEEGAPVSDLSIFLLGSVFGALCHQCGLLPLHASAVETGGAVTAFLGCSGAGKSTLAAFLGQRGHRIFSDDICLLEPTSAGLRSAPLAGWLKLWRESFDQIGVAPRGEDRTFSTDDKYRMYLPTGRLEMLKIRNFVFLERVETGLELERLSAAAGVAGLLEMIYPGYMPGSVREEERLFRQCAEALSGARAYWLRVPWGWESLPATVDLIERELLA